MSETTAEHGTKFASILDAKMETHLTMYEHDCLSNVFYDERVGQSFTREQGHFFEPLADRIMSEFEDLTLEEMEFVLDELRSLTSARRIQQA